MTYQDFLDSLWHVDVDFSSDLQTITRGKNYTEEEARAATLRLAIDMQTAATEVLETLAKFKEH